MIDVLNECWAGVPRILMLIVLALVGVMVCVACNSTFWHAAEIETEVIAEDVLKDETGISVKLPNQQ